MYSLHQLPHLCMLQRAKLVAGCDLKHVTAPSRKAWLGSLAQPYGAQGFSGSSSDGQH
jgi:hypothetical protein